MDPVWLGHLAGLNLHVTKISDESKQREERIASQVLELQAKDDEIARLQGFLRENGYKMDQQASQIKKAVKTASDAATKPLQDQINLLELTIIAHVATDEAGVNDIRERDCTILEKNTVI